MNTIQTHTRKLAIERLEPRRMLDGNASPGTLDTTFGNAGYVTTDFTTLGGQSRADTAVAVTATAGGSIYVAGSSFLGGQTSFAVARYEDDGTPAIYGSFGTVQTDLGSSFGGVWDVAVQSNGKTVVVGEATGPEIPTGQTDFAVVRYDRYGNLDPSFGDDGVVLIDFLNPPIQGGTFDRAFAVEIDAIDRIVIAGQGGLSNDFAVARLNPDGTLDNSFSGDGLVTQPLSGSDAIFDMVVDGSEILVAGSGAGGAEDDIYVIRYLADGTPDPNFGGGDGVAQVTINGESLVVSSLAVHDVSGDIAVAGSIGSPGDRDVFVARLDAAGQPISTFDGDGVAMAGDAGVNETAEAVIYQPDGRILTVGTSGFGSVLFTRFLDDGMLDPELDTDGIATNTVGSTFPQAFDASLLPDGRVLVAGKTVTGDFLLARFFATTGIVDFDSDQDGVLDSVENGAPNNGDGNANEIPDREEGNVASFPNSADLRYVTLVAPGGLHFANAGPANSESLSQTALLAGSYTFEVEGLAAPGDAVSIEVIFDRPVDMDAYFKFGPNASYPTSHWYEYPFETLQSEPGGAAKRIRLDLVDGGLGDADLVANGRIVDPGGAVSTHYPGGSAQIAITGIKYHDMNGNGERDTGEPKLPGWTVFLDEDHDGVLDAGEVSTVTDANGAFKFDKLARQTYYIAEVTQPGWVQTSPPQFELSTKVGTAYTNRGVAIGQINLDEDLYPDIVSVGDILTTLQYRTASGDYEQFYLPIGEGSLPEDAQIRDFNGDGLPDIAVLYTGDFNEVTQEEELPADIRIFYNQGERNFERPSADNGTIIPVSGMAGNNWFGVEPYQFVFGDLNGDGIDDIVTDSLTSNSVAVVTGRADGTFDPPSPVFFGTDERAVGIGLGNFDGDLALELAVALHDAQQVQIIDQPGAAGQQTLDTINLGETPGRLIVGDFTSVPDGDDDVAVILADSQQVRLLTQHAPGDLGLAAFVGPVGQLPTDIEFADLNEDGRFDILVANGVDDTVTVHLSNDSGGFTKLADLPVGEFPNAVRAGDLDGDGVLDFATANGSFNVSTYLGNPYQHQVVHVGDDPTPTHVEFGNTSEFDGRISGTVFLDTDRDGRDPGEPGLPGWRVFLDSNDNDHWDTGVERTMVTDSSGEYAFANLPAEDYEVRLTAQSGWEEVFSASSTSLTIDEGQPSHGGVDFGVTQFSEPGTIEGVVWDDLNADGVHDAGEPVKPGVRVFLDLNFDGKYDPVLEAQHAVFSDVDGSYSIPNVPSTRSYAVVTEPQADQEVTFPDPFLPPDDFAASNNPRAIATADFDLNGVLDVAVGGEGNPSLTMLFGLGSGLYKPPVPAGNLGTPVTSLVTLFADDDALPDLAVGREGRIDLLFNRPQEPGTFAFVPLTSDIGGGPMEVIDIDGDGDDDLAVVGPNGITLFHHEGGTLVEHSTLLTQSPPKDLTVADFRDLGAGSVGLNDIAVLTSRQIESPTGATVGITETTIELLTNNGDGTFTASVAAGKVGSSGSISSADLDNDGDFDLLAGIQFPGIPATGGFCLFPDVVAGGENGTDNIVLAFLLIVTCGGEGIDGVPATNALWLMRNSGDSGSFESHFAEAPIQLQNLATFPATDGNGAIVVGNSGNNAGTTGENLLTYRLPVDIFTVLGEPDYVLEIAANRQSTAPVANAVVDVDGDGDTDILVADRLTGSLTVMRNRGDDFFLPVPIAGHQVLFVLPSLPVGGRDFGVTSEDDLDGVNDAVESGAPNNGDGNSDGTPDADDPQVASLPNAEDGSYVTLEVSSGTLTDVLAFPGDIVQPPDGATLPVGGFLFDVTGLNPGEEVNVTFTLHGGLAPDTYYKLGPEPDNPVPHWWEFTSDGTTGAVINGNVIMLTLKDGGRGDADGMANGVIVDPGAPVVFANLVADFNTDGQVDSADLAQWNSAYGLDASADADGDGDSDGADFLAWQRNFGSSSNQSIAALHVEAASEVSTIDDSGTADERVALALAFATFDRAAARPARVAYAPLQRRTFSSEPPAPADDRIRAIDTAVGHLLQVHSRPDVKLKTSTKLLHVDGLLDEFFEELAEGPSFLNN